MGYRSKVRLVKPKPKCRPEPSIESRVRNKPSLGGVSHHTKKKNWQEVDLQRRSRALMESAASAGIGQPTEATQGYPAHVGAYTTSPAGDDRLAVQSVAQRAGKLAGVEPVVEDASLSVVGGEHQPPQDAGDGTQIAGESTGDDVAGTGGDKDEVPIDGPESAG